MSKFRKADLYIFSWVLVGIVFLFNFVYIGYNGNTQDYSDPGFYSGFYMPVDFSFSFWYGVSLLIALAIPCILVFVIIKHDSKLLIIAIAGQLVSFIFYLIYRMIEGNQLDTLLVIELVAWLVIAVSYMMVYFKKTLSVELYFVICAFLGSVLVISSIVGSLQSNSFYISYIINTIALSLCYGVLAIATNGEQMAHGSVRTTSQATAKDSGGQPINQGETTKMFCTNCGKESDTNASFCAFCGQRINPQGLKSINTNATAAAGDIESLGINILSFLFPIVGLILFIVWKDATPIRAKAVGKWAIIGVVVGIIGYVIVTACSASMLEY